MRLTTTRTKAPPRSGGPASNEDGCPNQHAIFERLETTKRYGLVSDYLVSWSGLAGYYRAKVTVWGRHGTPEDVVRHYIARLLDGMVPGRQINVAAD